MFNPKELAKLLKKLRREKRISLNQLARATGLSRRTLARIENVPRSLSLVPGTKNKVRPPGLSPRTAYKLARALLGEKETSRWLDEQTRLSRFSGDDPLYKFLDVLYHYPAFLFHDSPEQRALRAEFGADYTHSLDLLLRSGFGTRNLGLRLHAFRLQHDLTLVETAALLDLSKSELHRLERGERQPSPRTRYRILRLLTLPSGALRAGGPLPAFSSGQDLSGHALTRAGSRSSPSSGVEVAAPLGRQRLGRAGRNIRVNRCASVVPYLKELLAQPPPDPSTLGLSDSSDSVAALRHLWLAGRLSARQLASQLGISQPHLIRLLRGDRRPGKKLTETLPAFTRR